MLFGSGILLAGGGLLAVILLDTAADQLGFHLRWPFSYSAKGAGLLCEMFLA